MKSTKTDLLLALLVTGVVIWSACGPAEWRVWWMEMCWVLGAFILLITTYRRFRFSTAAYAIVSIWLVMHTIGAHYTFEHVPFGWFTEFFGFERNHYDRIAHYAIGLNSFMLAELFLRKKWASGYWFAAVTGILFIMAMACAWEIIEWIVAVIDGGDDGLAFLGSQGDIWDAQEDMLADTLGAVTAAALFVVREHRALKRLGKAAVREAA